MTKKDFELIAGVLKDTSATRETALAIGQALATTNPRFDIVLFMDAACDPSEAAQAEFEARRAQRGGGAWPTI